MFMQLLCREYKIQPAMETAHQCQFLKGRKMRLVRRFVLISLVQVFPVTSAWSVPSAELPGDFNNDGIVSHADFSFLGNNSGTPENFGEYRANYGRIANSDGTSSASSSSILPFKISPMATMDGNVEWTFTFSNVSGHLAGHLAIRVDGPNAPNILSVEPGPFMEPVPGTAIPGFTWLTLNDLMAIPPPPVSRRAYRTTMPTKPTRR
jgi:hypothetical protein